VTCYIKIDRFGSPAPAEEMDHFCGVHSLLQPDERRETIQDEAGNVAEEVSREARQPEGVAEANANNADEVASGAGGSQTARALRLLRSERQPPWPREVLPRSNEAVVQVVEPTQPATELQVGRVQRIAAAFPVAATTRASTPVLSEPA